MQSLINTDQIALEAGQLRSIRRDGHIAVRLSFNLFPGGVVPSANTEQPLVDDRVGPAPDEFSISVACGSYTERLHWQRGGLECGFGG